MEKFKYPEEYTPEMKKIEPAEITEKKVKALLKAMTEKEKLFMVHGGTNPPEAGVRGNAAYNKGVPRLGVPEIRMYDGPSGVQSLYETTNLPVQHLLGATFDREMGYEYGKVLGGENAAISGNVQFGAQFDMVRTPHFGRSKDSISEDPYLAAELAVEETKGIQENGAIANVKHYCAYSQDISSRQSRNLVIDEQTMHELYLPPFEAALTRGNAGSLMTSYSMIDGEWMTESKYYMQDVLRKMWNWRGFTVNDWGGIHKRSIETGLDLETPLGSFGSSTKIKKAIERGELSWEVVDSAVSHILYGMASAGLLAEVKLDEHGEVIEEEGRTKPISMSLYYDDKRAELLGYGAKVCLDMATDGAVLLKNDNNVLPLTENDYTKTKLGVIGVGAVNAFSGEGQERSFGVLQCMKSPADELSELTDGNVDAAVGIDLIGEAIPSWAFYQDEACTKPGLVRTYGITEEDGRFFNPMALFAGKKKDGEEKKDDQPNPFGMDPDDVIWEGGEAANQLEVGNGWFIDSMKGDWEGKETGSFMEISENINLTCGTDGGRIVRNYKNVADGTAMTKGQACTWKGYIKVKESGKYTIILNAIGGMANMKLVCGKEPYDVGSAMLREGAQWPWNDYLPTPEGMDVFTKDYELEAGKAYEISFVAKCMMDIKDMQARAAWISPEMRRVNREEAIRVADSSDTVVFFAWKPSGHHGNLFGKMTEPFGPVCLPEDQKSLLCEVAGHVRAHKGKLVLVVNCGTGMVLGDIAEIPDSILYMWQPGECGGIATARLLLGMTTPAGKLPVSFPVRDEDTPVTDTHEHFVERWEGVDGNDGKPGTIKYTEGIFTGYRWHDKEKVKPLYPFGYGLSYTKFDYSDISVTDVKGGKKVSVRVTNVGKYAGREVVQCYIGGGKVPSYAQLAVKSLCGFAKTKLLEPGESEVIIIRIDDRAFCYWNVKSDHIGKADGTCGKWERVSGSRRLMVCTDSDNILKEFSL